MTAVAPPSTPPTPQAAWPAVSSRRLVMRGVVRRAVAAARSAESALWAPPRWVARWPKASVALVGLVTATTPVTLREVAGVVVSYGCAAGVGYFRRGTARERAVILLDVSKFRKRKTWIRRLWVTVMTDAGLVKSSVNGGPAKRLPRILRIAQTPLGVAVLADAAPVSAGAAEFRAKANVLRQGFRCRDVKITAEGHSVRLDLRWEDPFKTVINFSSLTPSTKPPHATIGLDEDGEPVEKDLRLPNLIVGAKGSGKSSEIWTTLAALLAARIPFRLRVFDPKGGQEFAELEDAAWYYERNPTHWPLFLERAGRAMGARQAALRAEGVRDLTRFTDQYPLDVMIIDELLTALAFGAGTAKVKMDSRQIKASDAFMVYLSTCRSAGFTVLALSQLGQKEVIGPVRGLFDYATCLRVGQTEAELVDIMLGSGAHKAYPAQDLSPARSAAGIGFMRAEQGVVKYRAAYLTDAERHRVVRGVAALTARLRAASTAEESTS